jgi:heme O synthase-like polyprenyltransferase
MDWSTCVDSATGVATIRCVPVVLKLVINAALGFAGLVTLFLIIWAGVLYIRSQGDLKQAEAARKTISYAIMGLAFILFSFFIVNFIGYVTGVPCINPGSTTPC